MEAMQGGCERRKGTPPGYGLLERRLENRKNTEKRRGSLENRPGG